MSLPWVQNTVNVGGCFQHDSLPLGSPSGVPASEHQASDASQHEPHYGQPVPTVAGNSSSSQTSRAVLQQLSEAAAAEAAAVRSTLIAAQAALQGPGAGTPGPGSSTGSDAAGLHTPAIPHLPQDLTLPSRASATTDDSSSSAAASSPFNTPWALQEPRLQPQHPPPSLATLARQMSDLLEKTPVDTFDLSARPQLALYLDTTLERVSEVCSTVASEDVTPRTSLAGTGGLNSPWQIGSRQGSVTHARLRSGGGSGSNWLAAGTGVGGQSPLNLAQSSHSARHSSPLASDLSQLANSKGGVAAVLAHSLQQSGGSEPATQLGRQHPDMQLPPASNSWGAGSGVLNYTSSSAATATQQQQPLQTYAARQASAPQLPHFCNPNSSGPPPPILTSAAIAALHPQSDAYSSIPLTIQTNLPGPSSPLHTPSGPDVRHHRSSTTPYSNDTLTAHISKQQLGRHMQPRPLSTTTAGAAYGTGPRSLGSPSLQLSRMGLTAAPVSVEHVATTAAAPQQSLSPPSAAAAMSSGKLQNVSLPVQQQGGKQDVQGHVNPAAAVPVMGQAGMPQRQQISLAGALAAFARDEEQPVPARSLHVATRSTGANTSGSAADNHKRMQQHALQGMPSVVQQQHSKGLTGDDNTQKAHQHCLHQQEQHEDAQHLVQARPACPDKQFRVNAGAADATGGGSLRPAVLLSRPSLVQHSSATSEPLASGAAASPFDSTPAAANPAKPASAPMFATAAAQYMMQPTTAGGLTPLQDFRHPKHEHSMEDFWRPPAAEATRTEQEKMLLQYNHNHSSAVWAAADTSCLYTALPGQPPGAAGQVTPLQGIILLPGGNSSQGEDGALLGVGVQDADAGHVSCHTSASADSREISTLLSRVALGSTCGSTLGGAGLSVSRSALAHADFTAADELGDCDGGDGSPLVVLEPLSTSNPQGRVLELAALSLTPPKSGA